MSGIFGIFNRNGKEVEKNKADTMLEAISYWDPDERDMWRDGPVALGHAMLWNTPESKYEHLPLEHDAYVLTMDARIDNREALAKEIDLPDRPMSEIGDSEFILAAYEKWGEECLKHLLGDFVFAIWDEQKKKLFCARDHIGIKSFYYYLDNDLFIFSNTIEGIFAYGDIDSTFDNDTIAMYMQDDGVEFERKTFFENIKKLPAAMSLQMTQNNVYEHSYWKIEDSSPIIFDTYEEYIKKLRVLLENAVAVRVRTCYPVISHLSGGIDSSSIAVLAARILKKKEQKLQVFNWIDMPQNLDDYEYESWNFSRRIAAEEENIDHHEFSIDPAYMVQQYDDHNILTKGTMYNWREHYIQNAAYESGARIILSGWGGDELISNNGSSYIGGLLRQGNVFKAFKYLFSEKKEKNHLWKWKKFAKQILLVVLPANLIEFIRKKEPETIIESKNCIYASDQLSKILDKYKVKKFPSVFGVRKKQMMYYHNGHILERVESWALRAFDKRVEYCYPLLDKRIVEFAMGIPEELFYPREGECRHLIKNAVSDLLPSDILWFRKVDETKIDDTYKRQYTEALKILKSNMEKINCEEYKQNYINCTAMKESLLSFDFDKKDPYDLGKIITAYMLMNSIKKISLK